MVPHQSHAANTKDVLAPYNCPELVSDDPFRHWAAQGVAVPKSLGLSGGLHLS